jgi:hypothetical protein
MSTVTAIPRMFRASIYETPHGTLQTYHTGAQDRINIVRQAIDVDQLEEALTVPELQATVIAAINRRLKELAKACPE